MEEEIINIGPGDIGFSICRTNAISRVMALVMGSNWSHAWMVLGGVFNVPLVIETSDFEVTATQLDKYHGNPDYRFEIWTPIALTENESHNVCRKSLPLLGEGYGYLQLLSLGIRRLGMKLGLKIPNFIRQGLVCCHVVLYAYQDSPIKELALLDPESIDTEELYQIVSKSGAFRKVWEQ